jgi:glutaminyl-peptide cyclotransferase
VGAVIAIPFIAGQRFGAPNAGTTDEAPARLVVRVLRSFPHARDAFTQGLLWYRGYLYESTGLYGRSSLRKVDLESGDVLERRDVRPELFAEGLARVADHLFQLTWQEGRALVWTLDRFELVREIEYEGEGWGLCYDGTHLVMSDGSARLAFRDPRTFEVVRRVRVRDRGRPVEALNELECVDGAIWANVWQTDRIVRIDPRTGRVTAIVNAGGLLEEEERANADVLNGIAWIPERHHFVITGKLWPRLFEVEFVPPGTR